MAGAHQLLHVRAHAGNQAELQRDESRTAASDLRDAAQALMPHLRPEDVLAYVGNDSFAAIFPDMPADPAAQLLDDWGHSLRAREHNGSRAGPRCRCP